MIRIVPLLILIILIGCTSKSNPIIETETWSRIYGVEWSSQNGFAGDGFYFYEENGKAMCFYMIYGSGLPIIHESYSEVLSIEDNRIEVSVFFDMEDQDEIIAYLTLEEDKLYFGDVEYEILFERDPRDEIIDKVN